MLKDRIAEGVYVLTSDLYFEVTAGIVVTSEGAIIIDTLPFPSETKQLKQMALKESPNGIRYVILTHYHADHSLGSYLFEGAELIAHEKTRSLLYTEGLKRLSEAQAHNPELRDVKIILPQVTFNGTMSIHLGDKTLYIFEVPGHSPDSVAVYIKGEKVLFAGDAVMPLPYIVNGDLEASLRSLESLKELNMESIVQGHGGVLLKGEIPEVLESNIAYLKTIREKVQKALQEGKSKEEILNIDIEECGKSRITMGSITPSLHKANLFVLYNALRQE